MVDGPSGSPRQGKRVSSARPRNVRAARQRAVWRGRMAESLVALLLRIGGYRIQARRLRIGGREIDLIARNAKRLLFVEVKFRRDGTIPPELAPRQVRRLREAAQHYLDRVQEGRHPIDEARFDVAWIVWPRHQFPRLHYIRQAISGD